MKNHARRLLMLGVVVLGACSDDPADQPLAAVDDAYATSEDTALAVAAADGLLSNDGGDSATASVVVTTGPAHGQLTLQPDGAFTYVPTADYAGDDAFSYELADTATTATVRIVVQPVNDPPAGIDDAYVVTEDATLTVAAAAGVLANDTDIDGGTLGATVITPPASGTLTLSADGALVYQPAANFFGSVTFRYEVSDGVATRQANGQVQVTPVADPPAPVNDSYLLDEDTSLTVTAAAGVLANDVEPDGEALVVSLVTPPATGTLTLGTTGTILYVPAANFFGAASFVYAVTDGTTTVQAQVALQVNPINDAPVATNDAYTVDEDAVLTVAAAGVLLNDVDVDGDTLTVGVVTTTTSGALVLGGTGAISYQPTANFFGTDSFTYQVTDGVVTRQAQVQLTVNPRNDLPVAQAGTVTTIRNTPLPGQLVGTDIDGDPLTYAVATAPTNGSLTITAATGAFTYTPQAGYVGTDSFTFTARDAIGPSAPALIMITVEPPPTPTILTLYPPFGTTGVPLQIAGVNLGAATGSVTIDGATVPITTWTDRLVVVTVPVGLAAGSHNVVVTSASAQITPPASYEVRPWILDIEPWTAAANDVVTITGDSFGAAQGTIDIGGAPAVVQSWANDRVDVRVPAGAGGRARVRLVTAALQPSNASAITRRVSDLWLPSPIPAASQSHNSFWTGADMITWGPRPWRYEPRGDQKLPMATSGAPAGGIGAWIGTELVVYGSAGSGRYDAFEDTWSPINTTGMPMGGPAVWTGSRLLVWGSTSVQNAARFDPVANTWSPITATGAPSQRSEHAMAWTGTELFVWGGTDGTLLGTATGGLYNPSTNTWRTVTTVGAPPARRSPHAVWTGTHMIVWGGADPNNGIDTGGIYNPATNTWTTMTTVNAPPGGRDSRSIWTGTHMVVWGGYTQNQGELDIGGRFDPVANTWTATNSVGRASRRARHSMAWTGIDMIVWGGIQVELLHGGGIYTPGTDSWSPMLLGVPKATRSVAWTGTELTLLGEISGRFQPVTETWTPVNSSSGVYVYVPSTVWSGTDVIVWGGALNVGLQTGVRYTPSSNTWTPTTVVGAPAGRHGHVSVWTGTEMVVWGGYTGSTTSNTNGTFLNTGGRYVPATNSWTAMTTTGAPAVRKDSTAVWTGTEMLVWGGYAYLGSTQYPVAGGRYRPSPELWSPMSTVNTPTARRRHVAVWSGTELLIWGGEGSGGTLSTGSRYNPTTDTWTAMTTVGAPVGRVDAVATWTGTEMIVWGGFAADGGAYNPTTDTWRSLSLTGAPTPLSADSAVWTGREVIIWGDNHDLGLYVP